MSRLPSVTVELFGLARHRAGCSELVVHGTTVLEALKAVQESKVGLEGLVDGGSISRQYLVSLDGDRFVDDPRMIIPAGNRLLILGADPGG